MPLLHVSGEVMVFVDEVWSLESLENSENEPRMTREGRCLTR
jgi:hypothetical protein